MEKSEPNTTPIHINRDLMRQIKLALINHNIKNQRTLAEAAINSYLKRLERRLRTKQALHLN